jgi:polyisoprenoid-binding protein YceI
VTGISGTYDLGPGTGRVLVKTGRVGVAARAGHDLTLEITQWSARVTGPEPGDDQVHVTAEMALDSLTVRAGTGGAKPLADRDRSEIRKNAGKILGPGATASYASSRVISSADGGTIEGTLTLHGVSRPVPLRVSNPAPGQYRGSATVRQSDFGIAPYSGFFGALKLRDEVTVEFEFTLPERPATAGGAAS